MDWNDDRIAALTKMWREGFSASHVALQLGGVSRSAVIGKVHRLGIAGRDAPSRPRALGARPADRSRANNGGGRRLSAARAPKPPQAPLVAFNVSPTASVLTLSENSCRWPIGDPDSPEFGFCGRARTGAGSYCEGHAPMSLRRRESGMKRKEIDHLVRRYVDAPTWAAAAL